MVYVSHDLAVVAQDGRPDRRHVRRPGRRERPRRRRHRAAAAPVYARRWSAAIPDFRDPRALQGIPGVSVGVGEWPEGCAFAPRCEHAGACCARRCPCSSSGTARTRCAAAAGTRSPLVERRSSGAARAAAVAASDDALLEVSGLRGRATAARRAAAGGRGRVVRDLRTGRCVALVGESGSGKTTVGRCIAGLHEPTRGGSRSTASELAGTRPARRSLDAAPADPDRVPEPVRVAQPAPPGRRRRSSGRCGCCGACRAATPTREVGELLERVRLPAARRRPLPDRALGRRAPAGGDRARAGGEARPAGLRRGDLGARRLGAGRGARAAAPSCSASSG